MATCCDSLRFERDIFCVSTCVSLPLSLLQSTVKRVPSLDRTRERGERVPLSLLATFRHSRRRQSRSGNNSGQARNRRQTRYKFQKTRRGINYTGSLRLTGRHRRSESLAARESSERLAGNRSREFDRSRHQPRPNERTTIFTTSIESVPKPPTPNGTILDLSASLRTIDDFLD